MAWTITGDPNMGPFRRQEVSLSHTKPYVKPLAYRAAGGLWHDNSPRTDSWSAKSYMPLAVGNAVNASPGIVSSSNKALSKTYETLSQSEALLVAWKERQSALDLVAGNVGRLVKIARAVKRRDPKIVRAVLKRNPNAKDIIKQPAGLWLEYHFGIVPTVMDIHHGLGVLGFEFPVSKIESSSGATCNFYQFPSRAGTNRWWKNEEYTCVTKIGGEIYALNPNVHLLSMLGFGQPLSVAWEMTPFSWFIDYFVNVGELVKNLEPRFPGVKVRNKYTTTFVKSKGLLGYVPTNSAIPPDIKRYTSWYMERKTTWPSFQLEFKSPLDLNGQQCSYVTAVLIQLLTGMKAK